MRCFDCKKDEGVFHIICEDCHEKFQAENAKLKAAVGLLNSMVLSGERHSSVSKMVVKQVLKGR